MQLGPILTFLGSTIVAFFLLPWLGLMSSTQHTFAQKKQKSKSVSKKQKSSSTSSSQASTMPTMSGEQEQDVESLEQMWLDAALAAAEDDVANVTSWQNMVAKPVSSQEAINTLNDEDGSEDEEVEMDIVDSEDEEVDMDIVDSDEDDDFYNPMNIQLNGDNDRSLDIQHRFPPPLWLNPRTVIYPDAVYIDSQGFENMDISEIKAQLRNGKQEDSLPSANHVSILKSNSSKNRRSVGITWAAGYVTKVIEIPRIGHYRVEPGWEDAGDKAFKQRKFFNKRAGRKNLNGKFPIDVPEDETLWDKLGEKPCMPSSRKERSQPKRSYEAEDESDNEDEGKGEGEESPPKKEAPPVPPRPRESPSWAINLFRSLDRLNGIVGTNDENDEEEDDDDVVRGLGDQRHEAEDEWGVRLASASPSSGRRTPSMAFESSRTSEYAAMVSRAFGMPESKSESGSERMPESER